jgi:hypothetical protein
MAILLVSKAWLRIATPSVYHTVHLRSKSTANPLECTLADNPAVRHLVLSLVYPEFAPVIRACRAVNVVEITLDNSATTEEHAIVDTTSICQALATLSRVRKLIVHKSHVYLSQLKPRHIIAGIATAIDSWQHLVRISSDVSIFMFSHSYCTVNGKYRLSSCRRCNRHRCTSCRQSLPCTSPPHPGHSAPSRMEPRSTPHQRQLKPRMSHLQSKWLRRCHGLRTQSLSCARVVVGTGLLDGSPQVGLAERSHPCRDKHHSHTGAYDGRRPRLCYDVTAAACGKVFGIDSGNSYIIWSRVLGYGWAAEVCMRIIAVRFLSQRRLGIGMDGCHTAKG